ncbi:MAG: hypothetical protein PWQ78_908, partial [Petrotoga sp.]|nr:hypothetical protein [Petrotoga sp.]
NYRLILSKVEYKGGGIMSKTWLIVVGIYLVIMAIAGFSVATMPNWHAWIDIIVGIVSLIVGFMDKGKKGSAA